MKQKRWIVYLLFIALTEGVGFLAAVLTRDGMQSFMDIAVQPPLTPPAPVFPIVWGILYALMGISAARIWLLAPSLARDRGMNLFVIQLVLNFFWTLIFFNAQAYGLASAWIVVLWAVVLAMILQFRKVDRTAAWLQVPYLIWLTLATYLTFAVWLLNG